MDPEGLDIRGQEQTRQLERELPTSEVVHLRCAAHARNPKPAESATSADSRAKVTGFRAPWQHFVTIETLNPKP